MFRTKEVFGANVRRGLYEIHRNCNRAARNNDKWLERVIWFGFIPVSCFPVMSFPVCLYALQPISFLCYHSSIFNWHDALGLSDFHLWAKVVYKITADSAYKHGWLRGGWNRKWKRWICRASHVWVLPNTILWGQWALYAYVYGTLYLSYVSKVIFKVLVKDTSDLTTPYVDT